MRNAVLLVTVCLCICRFALQACGHGIPIHIEVDVANERLVVSGGTANANGFAPMMFVDASEGGDPFGEVTLPNFGPVILWNTPGFEIFGMDASSDLSFELLDRPVRNTSPLAQRVLWYWNPQTQLVEPAADSATLYLLARGNRSLTVQPNAQQAPQPLLLSDPIDGQQGIHNHSLLNFALDKDITPPAGAYGFFARMTSSDYAPSDPFLVVLNRGNAYSQMLSAAISVNTAALIAGDYDHNDIVNQADYVVWKSRYGQAVSAFGSADGNGNGIVDAADYTVWRNNLGVSASGSSIMAVPEPAGVVLVVVGVALLASVMLHRRRVLVGFSH